MNGRDLGKGRWHIGYAALRSEKRFVFLLAERTDAQRMCERPLIVDICDVRQ